MSWQMSAVGLFTRLTRKRRYTREAGGVALLAQEKGPGDPPSRLAERLRVGTREVQGRPVHVLRRRETPDGAPVVVYLHGGAYVNEIVSQHWDLVAELATELEAEVWVPLYGLAPDHHALEALDLVLALLAEARADGRACYLMGDSAGGGLALLAAQHAPERDHVAGLTLMAPWLDLTMSNPGIDAVEPHDPWLARPGLRPVAAAWARDVPLDDPRVSPIRGDLTGLPPVDLRVGTRDITLPDTRLLRERLEVAGVPVTYEELPGALHVYPLLPVPEGRRARAAMVALVRDRLADPVR